MTNRVSLFPIVLVWLWGKPSLLWFIRNLSSPEIARMRVFDTFSDYQPEAWFYVFLSDADPDTIPLVFEEYSTPGTS